MATNNGVTYCDKCHFEWNTKDTKIETLVLDEKDDRILVLSHKCLEYRPFNDGKKNCICTIHRWLPSWLLSIA